MILSGGSKVPRYECRGCKCLMETPTKTVKEIGYCYSNEQHYCGKCAPAYDQMLHGSYYRMMQCNYDGTPYTPPIDPMVAAAFKDAKKSK